MGRTIATSTKQWDACVAKKSPLSSSDTSALYKMWHYSRGQSSWGSFPDALCALSMWPVLEFAYNMRGQQQLLWLDLYFSFSSSSVLPSSGRAVPLLFFPNSQKVVSHGLNCQQTSVASYGHRPPIIAASSHGFIGGQNAVLGYGVGYHRWLDWPFAASLSRALVWLSESIWLGYFLVYIRSASISATLRNSLVQLYWAWQPEYLQATS